MQHTDWNDLSQAVRDLVEARTGPVRAARTASAGLNSQLAAVLDTADGQLFVKGLRTDHPGVVRQHREAMINPHVLSFAPRLRWQAEGAGWNVLAFSYPWRQAADYSPGSADVPAVVQVINRLQEIPCPDLPVKRAEQRWGAYVNDADLGLLTGLTLLHCACWEQTPEKTINVFSAACARLYGEIAREDPQPWKKHFAAVAQDWAAYRSKKHSGRCSALDR